MGEEQRPGVDGMPGRSAASDGAVGGGGARGAEPDAGAAVYDRAPWLTIAPGVRARGGAPLRVPGATAPAPAEGGAAGPDTTAGRGTSDPVEGRGEGSGGESGPTPRPGAVGGVHRGSGDPVGTAAGGRTTAEPPRRRSVLTRGARRPPGVPNRRVYVLATTGLAGVALLAVVARGAAGEVGAVSAPGWGEGATPAPASPGFEASPHPSSSSRSTGALPQGGPPGDRAAAAAGPGATGEPDSLGGARGDDWWTVLEALDRRRATSLGAADLEGVASYAQIGSPFWNREVELVAHLQSAGLLPEGWGTSLVAIEQVQMVDPQESAAADAPDVPAATTARPRSGAGADGGPARSGATGAPADADGEDGPSPSASPGAGTAAGVVLTVVDVRSGYRLRDRRGAVVRSIPEADRRRWRITLARLGSELGEPRDDALSAVADDVLAGAEGSAAASPGDAVASPGEAGVPWRITRVEAAT